MIFLKNGIRTEYDDFNLINPNSLRNVVSNMGSLTFTFVYTDGSIEYYQAKTLEEYQNTWNDILRGV